MLCVPDSCPSSLFFTGYDLYQSFVVVFNGMGTPFSRLCLFAFGTPLLVVVVTVAIDRGNYADRDGLCYLTADAVWAFAGPALAIMAVNLVIFVKVIRQILKLEAKDKRAKAWRAIKSSAMFFVLMGITWIPSQLVHFSNVTGQ